MQLELLGPSQLVQTCVTWRILGAPHPSRYFLSHLLVPALHLQRNHLVFQRKHREKTWISCFLGWRGRFPSVCERESHCSTVSTCIRATCNKPLIIYINTTSTCFQTGLRYTCTDQVFYFPHPFNVTSILEGKVLLLMHIYSRFVSYLADGALRICQQERSSNPFLASLWDFLVSPHSIQTADSRGLMTGDKQEII